MQVRSIGARIRFGAAVILTLGPAAILGYLGYRSVAERERVLRTNYTAASVLIRDRWLAEIAALEASPIAERPSATASAADPASLQPWLRGLRTNRPWLVDPFIAGGDGRIVTSEVWTTGQSAEIDEAPAGAFAAALAAAEACEFRRVALDCAIEQYRRAAGAAARPEQRALALFLIARTLWKLERHDEAVDAFSRVASVPADLRGAQGLPFAALARFRLVESFHTLGRVAATERAAAELVRHLIDHPWNVADGYGYYVRRAIAAGTTLDETLRIAAAARLGDVATIEWIQAQVRPQLALAGHTAHGAVTRVVAPHPAKPAVLVAARALPVKADGSAATLGFSFDADYIAGPLLASVLRGVDLGTNIRAEIVGRGGAGSDRGQTGVRPGSDRGQTPVLGVAEIGPLFPGWRVAIVDGSGLTIQQRTARERRGYGALVTATLLVLLAGVILTTRAWSRQAELARLQTDFVSNVTHELKTPLALIRMFGETLESGMVQDESRRREFSAIIRRESERLTHLIDNVLDTAGIDAGTKPFTPESGDLGALVREVLDAYAPLFSRLGFDVTAKLPEDPVTVSFDRHAVTQALVNVIQNAIKYSADVRRIDIAMSVSGSEVQLSVADAGIGIAQAEIGRIFERYYRAGAGGTSRPSGSGLGLSLVKHTMEVHGGRVDVTSAPGRGSTFTLVFLQGAA
jgi:signal transduction histidine kinase